MLIVNTIYLCAFILFNKNYTYGTTMSSSVKYKVVGIRYRV